MLTRELWVFVTRCGRRSRQIQISCIQSVCPVQEPALGLGVAMHACNHVWEAVRKKDSRPTKETKLVQSQPGLCEAILKNGVVVHTFNSVLVRVGGGRQKWIFVSLRQARAT